jgi:acyl carrier protein
MGQIMNEAPDNLVEQLKCRLIESLNLEGMVPEQIDAAAPLFGQGLGLDSLDAIEVAVLVERDYGVSVRSLNLGREVFGSVNSLAAFIRNNQAARSVAG